MTMTTRNVASVLLTSLAASTVIIAAQQPPNAPPLPAVDRANYRPAAPYEAVRTSDPTLPDQTLYRPKDLARLGNSKMPILAWGNGGCAANGGSSAEPALMEFASQGYLVGAGGTPPPAGARGPASVDVPASKQTATHVLTDFIDWAIKENSRSDSAYRGKIDTTKIALAGHSCGGLQAIALAGDKRLTTVVILNSGTIPRAGIPTPDGGTRAPVGYLPSSEDDLKHFRTPVLYLIGGPTDVAYQGSESDFKAIVEVPLFNGNYPVGHGATYRDERGGLFTAVATDWLDWQLKGKKDLAKRFTGPSCALCSAPHWTVKRKNM
jgi:hypothetical protein